MISFWLEVLSSATKMRQGGRSESGRLGVPNCCARRSGSTLGGWAERRQEHLSQLAAFDRLRKMGG